MSAPRPLGPRGPRRRDRVLGATLAVAGVFALGASPACGLGTEMDEYSCPPEGTELTYDNFGRSFFAVYCVDCHGGANAYSSRSLATVESIREQRERVFINSAADNTYMPPGPDGPPEELRERLAEWLVCGAP